MRLSTLIYICLSLTAAIASPDDNQNQNSINWSSLQHAMYAFLPLSPMLPPIVPKTNQPSQTMSITNPPIQKPTKTANLDNLPAPPRSLIPQLISAVPPTVLLDMVNPARRSALASDFKAGNTPSWYTALPTDVKSYLSVVKKEVNNGALTATTGRAYQTDAEVTTTATMAMTSSTATATSEGLAAAVPTSGLSVSALGALGVVGAALVF